MLLYNGFITNTLRKSLETLSASPCRRYSYWLCQFYPQPQNSVLSWLRQFYLQPQSYTLSSVRLASGLLFDFHWVWMFPGHILHGNSLLKMDTNIVKAIKKEYNVCKLFRRWMMLEVRSLEKGFGSKQVLFGIEFKRDQVVFWD